MKINGKKLGKCLFALNPDAPPAFGQCDFCTGSTADMRAGGEGFCVAEGPNTQAAIKRVREKEVRPDAHGTG